MSASTIVLLLVTPLNLGVNVGLIHYTRLGLFGSPVGLCITYWTAFAVLGLYTCLSPRHKANAVWSRVNLRIVFDWRGCFGFLKLAIPGVLMVGTEW